MGREIRMVPPYWKHPTDENGTHIPLYKGPFSKKLADWLEGERMWNLGFQEDWSKWPEEQLWKKRADDIGPYEEWEGPKPARQDYMPEFEEGAATHLCMYESTTEGTPISPAFATPEELAKWLADNDASAFGSMTASYDQWLATCRSGFAPSAVMIVGGDGRNHLESGVSAALEVKGINDDR